MLCSLAVAISEHSAVQRAGQLPQLEELLSTGEGDPTPCIAARFLRSLSCKDRHRTAIVAAGAVPGLVALLDYQNGIVARVRTLAELPLQQLFSEVGRSIFYGLDPCYRGMELAVEAAPEQSAGLPPLCGCALNVSQQLRFTSMQRETVKGTAGKRSVDPCQFSNE